MVEKTKQVMKLEAALDRLIRACPQTPATKYAREEAKVLLKQSPKDWFRFNDITSKYEGKKC